MRITVKPPSPAPSPPLPDGALVTLRVEAADPTPLLAGPPAITYEGRWTPNHTPAPGAFLFPAPSLHQHHSRPSMSDFRTPPAVKTNPYVDVPAAPGDVVRASLALAGGTVYTAALIAPPPGNPALVEMTLVEGGAAPPQPPPQPAPGLTITPHPDDEDVWTLDTAPGADDLIVVN